MIQLFYVWDSRPGSTVGNCALWWRPEGAGYTCDLSEAGKFTDREVAKMRATDKALPVDAVDALVIHHVRADTMAFAALVESVPVA